MQFEDELDVMLEVGDGLATSARVLRLGDNLFQLLNYCLIESPMIYDTFEGKLTDEAELEFLRIVQPSNWRAYEFILFPRMFDLPFFQTIVDRIMSEGGESERVFGGCFFVYLPPGSSYDPIDDITALWNN